MPSATAALDATLNSSEFSLKDAPLASSAAPARQWNIQLSPAARSSDSPIRNMVASISGIKQHSKPLINLGLGDPTVFGLHTAPPASVAAMIEALEGGKDNGYVPGAGTKDAKDAVAAYHKKWDGVDYTGDDVTLTHGTSHALDMCFSMLCSSGQNVVLPRPGFPAYENLLSNQLGVEIRYYDCLPSQNWECDLVGMEAVMDENTAFVLITNPSNPCGVSFPFQHVRDIVDLADRNKVVIIADEIYGHMVWGDQPFTPLAALSTSVPILTLSGLSKRFLSPGHRFGWIALHDPMGVAAELRRGLHAWANRIMGPNSILQKALPRILQETTEEWFAEVNAKLEINARAMHPLLTSIPGLFCSFPNAAMYLLLGIDIAHFPSFPSDMEFCQALVTEQAFFCIPGSAFQIKNHLRLVTAAPLGVMLESCERIREFCEKHYVA